MDCYRNRRGFPIEGTQAKNLKALLPLATPRNSRQCSLVTDDLRPRDLLAKGHLNHLLDMAMGEGMGPVEAVRMVTLNTAQYFGLRDVGAVAPGYRADLLILFLALPVIPELKLTDRGLVDVNRFEHVPLFVGG